MNALSEEASLKSISAGKWSRKQVLGHLIDSASNNHQRFVRAQEGDELRFGAGRDLRFYVHDLTDATVMIKDLGSHWEAILGNGQIHIWLTAGGDVTLVTDQEVKARPPNYLLGNIERPTSATDGSTTPTETAQQN